MKHWADGNSIKMHDKAGRRLRARSCNLAQSAVSGYLGRAKVANLGWPIADH